MTTPRERFQVIFSRGPTAVGQRWDNLGLANEKARGKLSLRQAGDIPNPESKGKGKQNEPVEEFCDTIWELDRRKSDGSRTGSRNQN